MLADDEGTQLKILSSLIHRLTPATELTLCCDGQEAWQAIQEGDTELLITDIRRLLSKMQERISALHRDAERSMDYEALLEQNLRDERQKLLLGLLYAVRSQKPSPLYDALTPQPTHARF